MPTAIHRKDHPVPMRRWLAMLLGTAALGAGPTAQAAPQVPSIHVRPVHGRDVGGGVRLWVDAIHLARTPTADAVASCTDGDQPAHAHFAKAAPGGLALAYNAMGAPSDLRSVALQTIQRSFLTWNDAAQRPYFTLKPTGGVPRYAQDGVNSVGWALLWPRTTLAVTYTWTGADGHILQADMFFNRLVRWDVPSACSPTSSRIDLAGIATHEVGHTLGLNHVTDPGRQATMYPSASAGEIRKRTLTAGDRAGVAAALS